MTWRRYGGPRLPLDAWELRASSTCRGRKRQGPPEADAAGPRAFAGHRAIEDACFEDNPPCPSSAGNAPHVSAGRVPYSAQLPDECRASCNPCQHHPGWMNNFDAPCTIAPHRCASSVCAEAPFIPKALRRVNYSGHHARLFALTAFPSLSSLGAANVTVGRLASLEGNPGIFQTPPRHARALASLTSTTGRRQLKLIVGLRDPFDLAFSLWSFLSSIGQEGRRVEQRMGKALAAIQACNDSLAESPLRLLDLSADELQAYRTCLDDRPRSRQHFYLYGGLYGLHLLGWLNLGYSGDQFLFVRMTSLPREAAQVPPLQRELASFLRLPPPPPVPARGVCISATMVTRKGARVRAHNASIGEVKREFKASPTAASLRKFLAGHQALFEALVAREHVRIF